MAELVDEGKVRWLGVCNFDVGLLERCEAIRHVDSLQPPLSLLNRHARRELIPWAREHGTGVIVYSPMASGLLTGAFDRERLERLAEDDWRRGARISRSRCCREPRARRAAASRSPARHGVAVAGLAVAWVLAQPGVTGAIVGARRPSQLDGWLGGGRPRARPSSCWPRSRRDRGDGRRTDEPPQPPAVA